MNPLFKLKCPGGALAVEGIRRAACPRVGDTITFFNFPCVERFVIERLERRADWFAEDWFEPIALVVRLDMVLQTAAPKDNVIAFNQDIQVETRLAKIEKIARKTVSSKLELEISHLDFVALCAGSGLSPETDDVDAFAYHDIPMTIGLPGETWNAATSFSGCSDDRHVLYVTWPCGTPFVMNADLFEVTKAFYQCHLSTEMAVARGLAIAVGSGVSETRALEEAMRKMFQLIGEGIMPVYDGAQELTRMTLPSYAAALKRSRTVREQRPAPEGTRHVSVSAGSGINVAGLLDVFAGLKPASQ